MSVLDKIKQIQLQEQDELRIKLQEAQKLRESLDHNKKLLFDVLKKNLLELDGQTIDNRKISIKETYENTIDLIVDDKLFAKFEVYTRTFGCGHDYQCECESTYEAMINVKTFLTSKRDIVNNNPYFYCNTISEFNKGSFPGAIWELLKKLNT